jgi:hypothetical protein
VLCASFPWSWKIEGEEWRPCPSFPGYMASSLGRVKHMTPRRPPRKPLRSADGYPCITYRYPAGRRIKIEIHAMVADAFIGPRPTGMVVNHIDANRKNSAPSNLEYLTTRDNVVDTLVRGTHYNCRHGYRAPKPGPAASTPEKP